MEHIMLNAVDLGHYYAGSSERPRCIVADYMCLRSVLSSEDQSLSRVLAGLGLNFFLNQ